MVAYRFGPDFSRVARDSKISQYDLWWVFRVIRPLIGKKDVFWLDVAMRDVAFA